MKHVGILAHSAEGSALCYLSLCHDGIRRLGPHRHPDVTLDVISMGASMEDWARGDHAAIRARLAQSAQRLAAAGCDFFICPDNTAHLALEAEGEPLALPGLHIAEVVARRARQRGFRTVGVLGTRWLMESTLYPRAFDSHGLDHRLPSADDRALIDRAIFEELCNGVFSAPTRAEFVRIIADLAARGCDAVVLGCTEIPLLIAPEMSPLPTLNSTVLLAEAALDLALGRAPAPDWRGSACLTSRAD
ncbi:Amino acid racemase [Bosea sp. 62]|uniref:aspartate/glutamate racemase family protein n=1 Tax=unclassified Bosea (in: a-proteobacteria) TaxID=2653178 RepID=UPI00125933F3|nr:MULTISPECIES: amino acid racemase [unclassified Bosea (in: a-proteobacteria)]CAD5255119.1 Amino acid racemase [Bosea sp. 21B]CAD5285194.1 Amino acid racemase [Bosea sp. 7B]CAD5301574.1 Amino acid racemase [Bosea sp. 46]VVT57691.1 Aspartate racemase [Bosea sp. EC-HK365B]VXB29635.1 Amino acid racemase [Bosea sp. 29B]